MERPGEPYPVDSWYTETAHALDPFPAIDGDIRADVAIVGGGFTGLSAALHLAERGVDVVLLEANRVGWGASGRNGGQIHSGQRRDVEWTEAQFGVERSKRLWALAEEAKALVRGLIDRHGIDCDLRDGLFGTAHKQRYVAGERRYVDKLRGEYGYDQIEWVGRDDLAEALGTDVYFGGMRDAGAGHLHPLNFALGLARAAAAAGARIHEATVVTGLEGGATPVLVTPRGRVSADTVILAGNGYLDGVEPDVESRVMPINNYVLTTEPIGAGAPGGILKGGEAASDSRFVIYYWRPTPDGRLLFGGGETYTRTFPADVRAFVRKHMLNIYPQFRDARIDHAWGGTLAVTVNRLPYIRKIRTGVYVGAGYSGQGVTIAPLGGKLLADALTDAPDRLDDFASMSCPPFPGGKWLRTPTLVAAMTWFALRDRL
ncbi:NAD(P)/FAD-dependent oxidoreductase [Microbaculum marinisediminis]|uniref:FAD-binding oxidoreductase n=1 Tax=Microbaculum marinisediminis TaxID=2931392 RepID=A0AAW5QSP5_9HYPH|nr:FAD-binding oxidoreductase [Microbaculum sp. A6E488]MCT8970494.1 FAD-binding oxidoreductase [Microbaculum sp. A6E488]